MDDLLSLLPFLVLAMAGDKRGIEAGRAYVKAWLDDTLVGRGLKRMSAGIKSFGRGLKLAGAGIAGLAGTALTSLGGAAKVFADMGSDMLDFSQRTGVGVEALSELKYAAQQSGADVAALEKGFVGLAKFGQGVRTGSKAAIDTLKALGLESSSFLAMSPEEQFTAVADSLSRIEDPGQRAALAMKVLGKSGTQLLPMMLGGAKGIEALREEARKLGLSMSTKDAKAAEAFGDQMSTLGEVLKVRVFSAGAAVVPVLSQLVEWITRGVAWAGRWIDRNRGLVAALAAGAVAVGALGVSVVGLGYVLSAVGAALGMVTGAIALFASPVAWAVAGVAALAGGAVYLAQRSGYLGEVLDWLRQRFGPLLKTAEDTFGGIKDALEAGDLKLAAEIALAGIKLAWLQGTRALGEIWDAFVEKIDDAFGGFFSRTRDRIKGLQDSVSNLLLDINAGQKDREARELENEAAKLRARREAANSFTPQLDGQGRMVVPEWTDADEQALHDLEIKAGFARNDARAAAGNTIEDDNAAREKADAEAAKREAEQRKREEDAAAARLAELQRQAREKAAEAARDKAVEPEAPALPEDEAAETAKRARRAAQPAINTAAVVGSDPGQEAFLKAIAPQFGQDKVVAAINAGNVTARQMARDIARLSRNPVIVTKGKT